MLTEAQLLMLNNLIYLNDFANSDFLKDLDSPTVGDFLKRLNTARCGDAGTTDTEWEELRQLALTDETLCSLKVKSMYKEVETGAKMACFETEDGEVYAIFAGTGPDEWRDDCVAGDETDSIQQQKALEWLEQLPYERIHVSGHSKGGNKAMYVAITSDKVIDCWAFDGEGFSNEFCEKYGDRIAERKNLIHLRASYRDYVNVLLNYIAGDIQYVWNDGGVGHFGIYHAPKALFAHDRDGNIIYDLGDLRDTNDPTLQMFHELTIYLINNVPEAERILVLSVLGEALTKFVGGDTAHAREDILKTYGVEGAEIFLRYFTLFLQELLVKDPEKYSLYRSSFGTTMANATGFGFWDYLLGIFLLEPLSGPLFDKIANGTVVTIYQTAEFFAGANLRARDFSVEAKERMLGAARETEEEPWWRADRWDIWYRMERHFGGMQWDQYTGRVNEYYRKLIDINDASVKDVEAIFEEVHRLDDSYSEKINGYIETLRSDVKDVLKTVHQSIHPK